jgi:hypothetical protein
VFPSYDDPLLVESGLVIHSTDEHSGEDKRYDRFRDRVMFPIRNIKGECIGFGGRVLGDEKPKYLNSPECSARGATAGTWRYPRTRLCAGDRRLLGFASSVATGNRLQRALPALSLHRFGGVQL